MKIRERKKNVEPTKKWNFSKNGNQKSSGFTDNV